MNQDFLPLEMRLMRNNAHLLNCVKHRRRRALNREGCGFLGGDSDYLKLHLFDLFSIPYLIRNRSP